MQSSLWKLLTAAGIIGIGTLVVLEVQNRVRIPRSSTATAGAQAIGTDISVTPDASTEFDRMLASAGDTGAAAADPASFDHPNSGTGTPAPPADNSTFYGAVDRTVKKDSLSDSESPFAMEEPAFALDETSGSAADNQTVTNTANSANSIKPVSFASEKPGSLQPVPATSNSATDDDPVIPFPDELPPNAATNVDAPKPTPGSSFAGTPAAPNSSVGEKNDVLFFPIEGDAADSVEPVLKQPKPASNKPTAAPPATSPRTQTSAIPSAAGSAKTVERTSATLAVDERPEMFVPEPVPDISVPTTRTPTETDDAPIPDPPPFGEDAAPSPISSGSGTHPKPSLDLSGKSSAPNDATEPLFFEPDSPAATDPSRPATGVTDDGSETLPFMEDEGEVPAPGTNEPRPAPANDFPEPRFPDRTPRSEREPLNSDLPDPFDGPDDTSPDRTEPKPLPTADDPAIRPGRTDRGIPSPTNDGTSRTVSEIMRPQLTIQKRAPDTATVGVSHDYTIVVTNEGDSSAYDVIVEDELGGAAEFVDADPAAEHDRSTGELTWKLAELPAGKKKEITVRIRPTGEGTLDGVATVRFKAQVKSATVITAPKLELDLVGPDAVKVGEEVPLVYTIRNNGSGDATNVILRSVLPPGLKHPEGGDLEYEIEVLPAGEQQEVELTVVAAEPGDRILVAAEVTASGISAAKARMEIEIVGAQLTLERHGPERRYVGRSAMYQNIVSNDSQFEATNAIVVEEVPEGMRFVSAGNGGTYNPDNRRIRWSIPRLGAGKQSVLDVELMAETAGRLETIVEVTEDAGFRTPLTENTIVTVEDLHNLTADISRQDEPVAIGERFGFTVTIDNRGTAVARNVEMSVLVPAEIRVLAAGTRQVPGKLMPGNIVRYNTVLEIQPNDTMTFQVTLQGEQPIRNSLVQASLKYDEMPEPLIVSESVTVFDDRP